MILIMGLWIWNVQSKSRFASRWTEEANLHNGIDYRKWVSCLGKEALRYELHNTGKVNKIESARVKRHGS